jgi:hypothetical protein
MPWSTSEIANRGAAVSRPGSWAMAGSTWPGRIKAMASPNGARMVDGRMRSPSSTKGDSVRNVVTGD